MVKTWPTLTNAIEEARFNPAYVETQLPEMLILAYIAAKAGAPAALDNATPATPSSTSPALPMGQPGGTDLKSVRWESVDWTKQSG